MITLLCGPKGKLLSSEMLTSALPTELQRAWDTGRTRTCDLSISSG